MAKQVDIKAIRKKLQHELISNPPPVSRLRNSEMLNYLQMLDAPDNAKNIWLTLQVLTDLNRFNRELIKIKDIYGDAKNNGITTEQIDILRDYAKDFYSAWNVSSNEVIKYVGFAEVLEIFRLLRIAHKIAWSDDAIEYLENCEKSEVMHVFRGECKPLEKSGMCSGLSWTLDRSVAQYYALRLPDGVIHEGDVSFSDVLLFQFEESEVVVNPGSVTIISTVEVNKS